MDEDVLRTYELYELSHHDLHDLYLHMEESEYY